MTQRLKKQYLESIHPALIKEFNYKNTHQVPKVTKVVLNRGMGEATQNPRSMDTSLHEVSVIAGQKGGVTRSRQSIASFKLREEMPIGISVTLRGDRMYSFLDRLINLALPRIRDFQGISSTSFDGRGNYNLGLEEQLMFPEIEYDKIDRIRGMDISIVTNSSTDQEGLALLKAFGMPFKNQ